MAPNGTAMLVSMRAQLLDRLTDFPLLLCVDADLRPMALT
jgi:hypothetical protein